MIFIKTKYYPAKGFNAITHWPFVFYKYDNKIMRNHEALHGAQQKVMFIISLNILAILSFIFNVEYVFVALLIGFLLLIPATKLHKLFGVLFVPLSILLNICFYLIYFIEYIFKGYRGISFEKEAYKYQGDYNYLENRKIFAQWRQLKIK